jgi:hypothetical protein
MHEKAVARISSLEPVTHKEAHSQAKPIEALIK